MEYQERKKKKEVKREKMEIKTYKSKDGFTSSFFDANCLISLIDL